jgi:hypothetical protein
MTERRTPQQIISDLLRVAITDPNTIRRALNTEWVYPDIPRLIELSEDKNNFPRISVEAIGVSSRGDIGMDSTETEDTITLSVDAWAFQDSAWAVTVGGNSPKTLSGNNLCEALIQQAHIYLRDNWRTATVPYFLFDYTKTGTMPYEDELEGTIKRYGMSISFVGVNIGD